MRLEASNSFELRSPPAKFRKEFHKTTYLPLKSLCVKWVNAQRPLNAKDVEKIANSLDPDLFGNITTTLPDGRGMYHVIDGNHRVNAARTCFGDDEQKVPCQVLNISDPVRAAEVFDRLNTNRRKVSALEHYIVRVTAKYADYMAVDAIVKGSGYQVVNAPGDGHIRAVNSLMHVYRKFGGDALKNALKAIRNTWGADANAVAGPIIIGYGGFIGAHSSEIDYGRLAEQMQKRFTPGRLIGRAKARKEITGASEGAAVKKIITDTYNSGLRAGSRLASGKDD